MHHISVVLFVRVQFNKSLVVIAAGRQSEVLCGRKKSESYVEERLKILPLILECNILFLGFVLHVPICVLHLRLDNDLIYETPARSIVVIRWKFCDNLCFNCFARM